MKRTGSARKLMDAVQRHTIGQNFVDLNAALEEIVDGHEEASGDDVAQALGSLYKHHGHWEWVRDGFFRVLQWVKPEGTPSAN